MPLPTSADQQSSMTDVRQPPPDSLATLASAFCEKVEELQQATALRCADLSPHAAGLDALEVCTASAAHICCSGRSDQHLAVPGVRSTRQHSRTALVQATLQSLGSRLQQIEAAVQRERAHFPQVAALLQALNQQGSHLKFISENLPPFLPAASHPQPKAAPASAPDGAADVPQQGKENDAPSRSAASIGGQLGNAAPPAVAAKQKKAQAPRRWVPCVADAQTHSHRCCVLFPLHCLAIVDPAGILRAATWTASAPTCVIA